MIDLAENDRIPLILTVSSTAGLPAKGEYVFRYFTNADGDTPVMAGYAFDDLDLDSFGILHVMDNFGISYAERFKEEVEKRGGRVLGTEGFQYSDLDYRTQLTRIKEKAGRSAWWATLSRNLGSRQLTTRNMS